MEADLRQAEKLERIGDPSLGDRHDFNTVPKCDLCIMNHPWETLPGQLDQVLICRVHWCGKGEELVKQIYFQLASDRRSDCLYCLLQKKLLKIPLRGSISSTIAIRQSSGTSSKYGVGDDPVSTRFVTNLCTNADAMRQSGGGRSCCSEI